MTPKTDDTFACVEASKGCKMFASALSYRNTAGPTVPVMVEGSGQPEGSQGALESDNAY